MATSDYVSMLRESLQKKVSLLRDIIVRNEEQHDILLDENASPDEFQANIDAKDELVQQIVALDEGFDSIFKKVENELAANKATVCFVGTPKRSMEFTVREWENLNRKELTVTGSWMSYSAPWPGREWQQVADRFASGVLKVTDEMIDSAYSLDEISEGMEKFDMSNSITGKLLIKCQ